MQRLFFCFSRDNHFREAKHQLVEIDSLDLLELLARQVVKNTPQALEVMLRSWLVFESFIEYRGYHQWQVLVQ